VTIRALRILPPMAIARLGSAPEPVGNYTLDDNPDQPLEFRELKLQPTFVVDPTTGEISGNDTPTEITFKDVDENGSPRIRPVAPFLEVWALTDKGNLEPLTVALLRGVAVGPESVEWNVRLGNRKAARRTGDQNDAVHAATGWFSHHEPHRLEGHCPNFVKDAHIDFGSVRYIRPNHHFPEIRLRFTPAKGLIYGPNGPSPRQPEEDPFMTKDTPYVIPPERQVYDVKKGGWCGFEVPAGIDNADPDYEGDFFNETMPPSLFASLPPAPPWLHDNVAISRGYLDDACDGIVEVRLKLKDGKTLTAAARVTAGPPMMVPDSLYLRNLADDLDQVIHGPAVPADEPEEVTRARAMDIVRRAFETVRFLNVAVMNGNPVNGRDPLDFDTMPAEEAFDVGRLMRPVVPERTADTLMILGLHQQVYSALRGGATPWFADVLRRPDEVADFTNHGRRKMPAMMCGADGNYLALTWRQIQTIVKASQLPGSSPSGAENVPGANPLHPGPLTPRNLSAQLHYVAAGNPVSTRPLSSVSNCTPGLEFDMRAVWRRIFVGIELREYDNLVIGMTPEAEGLGLPKLAGHRLLRVNDQNMMTQAIGPSPASVDSESVVLGSPANPFGIVPLEWSNALAHILHAQVGKKVKCHFSAKPVWLRQERWNEKAKNDSIVVELEVRPFFEKDTAVIAAALAQPGELTQGLCSPWQNDYRECSCYYWASARPDYVNIEPTASGASRGDNWMQKDRTGTYVADDYVDTRILHYDDLFYGWERELKFEIGGRDVPDPEGTKPTTPVVPPPQETPAAKRVKPRRRK